MNPDPPAAGIPRSVPTPDPRPDDRTPVRRLEFVEVRSADAKPPRAKRMTAGATDITADATDEPSTPIRSNDRGWSLWGDVDL